MPIPTTNATQELPAINEILASVGQAPVTTLDQTNPDVAIAYDTLIQVSREVQAEGWTFNKDFDVKVTPDSDDYIKIPNNVLQAKLNQHNHRGTSVVIRRDPTDGEKKLYDRTADPSTYKFTDATYRLDYVYYFDWIDLPTPIQDFIVARAAVIVSSRIVGDSTQYQMLQQKEAYNRALAMEYECNQGDHSFFGQPQGTDYHISYQPYKALVR